MDGTKLDGVKLMQFDLDSVEIIEMLSKADIKNANWMGITEKQKEKLLHKNIFYMAIYSK